MYCGSGSGVLGKLNGALIDFCGHLGEVEPSKNKPSDMLPAYVEFANTFANCYLIKADIIIKTHWLKVGGLGLSILYI